MEDIYKSLFLYAVMHNMIGLAVKLWGYGTDALMKALVGELMFRNMAKRAEAKQLLSFAIREELWRNSR